jgi:thioredoxin 1
MPIDPNTVVAEDVFPAAAGPERVARAKAKDRGNGNDRAEDVEPVDAIGAVTETSFSRLVLEASGPVAVEFMSYDCGHCLRLAPELQEVATMLEGKIRFYRVDLALEEHLAEEYGIAATPTILMFSDGKELGRVEGPEPSVSALLSVIRRPFGL